MCEGSLFALRARRPLRPEVARHAVGPPQPGQAGGAEDALDAPAVAPVPGVRASLAGLDEEVAIILWTKNQYIVTHQDGKNLP